MIPSIAYDSVLQYVSVLSINVKHVHNLFFKFSILRKTRRQRLRFIIVEQPHVIKLQNVR